MNETICINALTFYGLCLMSALGFVNAVVTVWKARREEPESPFKS